MDTSNLTTQAKKPSFLPDSADPGLSGHSLYESHFGLREKPFNLTPDPKYLFMSSQHQEALAHLVFGIQENKGFVTITGEVGTGKTTLCRSFLSNLDQNIKVGYIFNPCLTDIELLQTINDELNILSNSKSKKYLIDELNRYLLKEKKAGNKVILIIDEAQNLEPVVLEQLRLLSNLETDTDKLIQIVLIGQPELEEILSRKDLRQLRQRISISWELLPLNKDDTLSYIQHRIKIAGGNGKLTFTRNAVHKIYKYSEGIPRLINVIADRALIIAFALDKTRVGQKTIQSAIKDIEKSRFKPKNALIKRVVFYAVSLAIILSLGLLIYIPQRDIKPAAFQTSIPKSAVSTKEGAAINKTTALNKRDSLDNSLNRLGRNQIGLPPLRETQKISATKNTKITLNQLKINSTALEVSKTDPPNNVIDLEADSTQKNSSSLEINANSLNETSSNTPGNNPANAVLGIPQNNIDIKEGSGTTKETTVYNTIKGFKDFLSFIEDHSRLHAVTEILNIWNLDPLPPNELYEARLEQLETKRGLSFFEVNAGLNRLKLFNYPAVLIFQSEKSETPIFLLLAKIKDKHLSFIFNGQEVWVSKSIVSELWAGKAYIFWKNFENIDFTLKNGFRGYAIVWLSLKLNKLGFYEYGETDFFDNNLENAVKRFQIENQLEADGVVGRETKIVLYNKAGFYKSPKLVKNTQ